LGVDVGFVLNQQLHYFSMSAATSPVKRSASLCSINKGERKERNQKKKKKIEKLKKKKNNEFTSLSFMLGLCTISNFRT
jgi:fructose-1,6-bisphosphatase